MGLSGQGLDMGGVQAILFLYSSEHANQRAELWCVCVCVCVCARASFKEVACKQSGFVVLKVRIALSIGKCADPACVIFMEFS